MRSVAMVTVWAVLLALLWKKEADPGLQEYWSNLDAKEQAWRAEHPELSGKDGLPDWINDNE